MRDEFPPLETTKKRRKCFGSRNVWEMQQVRRGVDGTEFIDTITAIKTDYVVAQYIRELVT